MLEMTLLRMGRSVVCFLFHSEVKLLTRFGSFSTFVMLAYLHAISMRFYVTKCQI